MTLMEKDIAARPYDVDAIRRDFPKSAITIAALIVRIWTLFCMISTYRVRNWSLGDCRGWLAISINYLADSVISELVSSFQNAPPRACRSGEKTSLCSISF